MPVSILGFIFIISKLKKFFFQTMNKLFIINAFFILEYKVGSILFICFIKFNFFLFFLLSYTVLNKSFSRFLDDSHNPSQSIEKPGVLNIAQLKKSKICCPLFQFMYRVLQNCVSVSTILCYKTS